MFDFGFIGCGHMGSELAREVAKSGKYSMVLSDVNEENARKLALETKAEVSENISLIENSQFIVLGVRPQSLEDLAKEISPALQKKKDGIIISMIVGIECDAILKILNINLPIIRIMPNTPVALGQGVILYTSKNVPPQNLEIFKNAFSACGELAEIDESRMDAAGCISSCGPAFVYKYIEAYTNAGCDMGIDRETSLKLVLQTIIGSVEMVKNTGKSPLTLCGEVCSKGGTTECGVREIDNSDFDKIMQNTLSASLKRTIELKK